VKSARVGAEENLERAGKARGRPYIGGDSGKGIAVRPSARTEVPQYFQDLVIDTALEGAIRELGAHIDWPMWMAVLHCPPARLVQRGVVRVGVGRVPENDPATATGGEPKC
jgi:hypothetical protein